MDKPHVELIEDCVSKTQNLDQCISQAIDVIVIVANT